MRKNVVSKKLGAILLTAGLTLSLAACGGSGSSAASSGGTESTSAAAGSASEAADSTSAADASTAGSDAASSADSAASGGAASSADASSDVADDDDTLSIAVSASINTIDPIQGYDTELDILINSVTEGLFVYDENSEVKPFLVSDYTQTDDVTYVYQIRDDVTFSDGTPLTAEDVVFSLERQRDEELGSLLSWMFESVDTIEQTGDYEVTVTLKQVDPTWQYVLATPAGDIVSKAYYEANAGAGTSDGGLIGSGPYVITDWDTTEVDMEYNEDYWNAAETDVGFKKLQFLQIDDQSVVKSALESGQVDLTQNISIDAAKELSDSGAAKSNTVDYLGATFLSYNTSVAPLDDVRVRQAIAYGIDTETILTEIVGDYGTAAKSLLFSENIGAANKDLWGNYFEEEKAYNYDPEAAKALLEEAGYGDGLELTLKYHATQTTHEQAALYIQQNLAEIGVTINLEGIDDTERSTLRYGGSETRDYELFLTFWASDYPDPVGTITPMYYSTNNVAGGSNWAEYNSPDFDAAIDTSNGITDTAERIEVLKQALDILQEDIPYYPLYIHYKTFVTSNRVEYTFTPMVMYNIYTKDIHRAQ